VSFDPNRKPIKNLKKNQNYPSTDKLNHPSLLKKVYGAKKTDAKKTKKNNLTTLPK
jgi:hypothetical protein